MLLWNVICCRASIVIVILNVIVIVDVNIIVNVNIIADGKDNLGLALKGGMDPVAWYIKLWRANLSPPPGTIYLNTS